MEVVRTIVFFFSVISKFSGSRPFWTRKNRNNVKTIIIIFYNIQYGFSFQICSQPYSYKHDFNRHCLKKHGVFLKRRNVRVMNEEVLQQERATLRDLSLRAHGIIKDDEVGNPFDGPQAALAYELAMKAIEDNKVPIIF